MLGEKTLWTKGDQTEAKRAVDAMLKRAVGIIKQYHGTLTCKILWKEGKVRIGTDDVFVVQAGVGVFVNDWEGTDFEVL